MFLKFLNIVKNYILAQLISPLHKLTKIAIGLGLILGFTIVKTETKLLEPNKFFKVPDDLHLSVSKLISKPDHLEEILRPILILSIIVMLFYNVYLILQAICGWAHPNRTCFYYTCSQLLDVYIFNMVTGVLRNLRHLENFLGITFR